MKKVTTALAPTTHFEQIPLDIVKRIARVGVFEAEPLRPERVLIEPLSRRKADVEAEHFHAVQFYDDADALCRIVGHFIGEGLEQDAVAVLIVTPDHADRIESCLRTRSIDIDALKRRGAIVVFDARATLELLMTDGMPNPAAFRRVLGAILTDVRQGHGHRAIRAYGEMVDLLWKDGLEAAAIRLETLWNQLADTHEFDLLCGYSMGNFYKGAALDKIKRQHTHLMTTGSASQNPAPAR